MATQDSLGWPPPPRVTQHCCVVGSHDCEPHDICVLPPLPLPLLTPPLPLPVTPPLPLPLLPFPPLLLPEPELPPPSAAGPLV
jgi:hypothetical protein